MATKQIPTIFNLLMKACGLSLAEAAKHLSEPKDTVKSWSAGRRICPDKVLSKLHDLANRIESAATMIARDMRRSEESIDLKRVPWFFPEKGAHAALLARIVAMLPDETEYE